MDMLNALMTSLAGALLAPFRNHPATGLMVWSIVTGVVMTYVFGKTSNQRALRRAADNIRAQLFAVKLFKEDLVVTFHCQVSLLKSTAVRLMHSIPPMLVMIVPLLFVLTQLAMRYEFSPLVADQETVVAVHVKPEAWKATRDITLESREGFTVQTEALRDEKASTVYWRVSANGTESTQLTWKVGDQTVEKALPISATPDELKVANPIRSGRSFWDLVLYPAEASLPADCPIDHIEITLEPRATPIWGWNIPWWATFFVVSMVIAFVTGKIVGVQY